MRGSHPPSSRRVAKECRREWQVAALWTAALRKATLKARWTKEQLRGSLRRAADGATAWSRAEGNNHCHDSLHGARES